jgi:hypothetical protein
MAKKPSGKGAKKAAPKTMTADDHRKMASTHHAKARLHGAKAELMDAENPPPKSKKNSPVGYY